MKEASQTEASFLCTYVDKPYWDCLVDVVKNDIFQPNDQTEIRQITKRKCAK